jgi:hypothetical protein
VKKELGGKHKMSNSNEHYIFLEVVDRQGTSQKTGQDYHILKITFADPETLENHTVDLSKDCDYRGFAKGEKVQFKEAWKKQYNRDSVKEITSIMPYTK